jgi:mRNA interferase YafQ
MALLDEVVTTLVKEEKLPTKFKPHLLKGNYQGYWECHIQPDWLLIWKQDETIKLITLTRTGSHSDLFK